MTDNSTLVFGAQGAKIKPLLTDGGTPTYGAEISIPGLKSVETSSKSGDKVLRGGNRLIAKISTLESVEVKIKFAKWDPQIYALVTGAAYTEDVDGSYLLSLNVNSSPKPFRLEAVSVTGSGEGSNISIIFPQLVVTNLPDMVGLSEEDFKTVEVTCEAIPMADGTWIDWAYNKTALVL